MLVAVALFGNEISPRLDCCTSLAFVPLEGEWSDATRVEFDDGEDFRRLQTILDRETGKLLCGGIRRRDWMLLSGSGVEIVANLTGGAQPRFEELKAGLLIPVLPTWKRAGGPCRRRRGPHRQGGSSCQDMTRQGRKAKGR